MNIIICIIPFGCGVFPSNIRILIYIYTYVYILYSLTNVYKSEVLYF